MRIIYCFFYVVINFFTGVYFIVLDPDFHTEHLYFVDALILDAMKAERIPMKFLMTE